MEKPALTIAEVVKLGPFSKTALYDRINNGELPARKAGRLTVILRQDYLNFLARLPQLAPKAGINRLTCPKRT